MRPDALNNQLEFKYFDSIDSTNKYLLNKDINKDIVISTDNQTNGCGRRGKSWQQPTNALMFSAGFITTKKRHINRWPIVCATSVCRSLNQLISKEIFIKWPNDLIIIKDDSIIKFCGILVESQLGEMTKVISGVGINLSQPKLRNDYLIGYLKIDLKKNDLLTYIVNNLYKDWLEFLKNQQIDHASYEQMDILKNRKISATNTVSKREIIGTAQGIDNNGYLNIKVNGIITPYSGIQNIRLID